MENKKQRKIKGIKNSQVSAKLGLKRLEKRTKLACRKRAMEIEKLINKNKVPKNLLEQAISQMYAYRSASKAS